MDDHVDGSGPDTPLLGRRATRRSLLAGAAAAAAAGTAVAVVAVANQSGGHQPAAAANGSPAAAPTPAPTPDANRPIADPLRRAAHLLRRAGFGGAPAEVEAFARLSREDAADRLLNYETIDNAALDARIAAANFNLVKPGRPPEGQSQLIQDMIRWWLTRMAYTARPLEERMTFIWHGLLTSQISTVGGGRAKLMVQQNELFRRHALGRYDDLIKAVAHDPAMMIYLDTDESTRDHPNENFARELMELFTMGVGYYTEQDIRESARAFTGWRITPPPRIPNVDSPTLTQEQRQELRDKAIAEWDARFQFAPRLHDFGAKTFLGKTGPFDGDDIVDIIMSQPATGRFVATRLFTEFANFNPEPATIDRLAAVWESSGHSIKAVVRAILVSDEFYSERSYRSFVRSPIELAVGVVRALELDADFRGFDRFGRMMDQVPFEPPNVAGWPGGETWLSSSTFFARTNYLDFVFFNRGRPLPIPVLQAAATSREMADIAVARLVDGAMPAAARAAIAAFAETQRPIERPAAVAYLVAASPEFQLA